MRRPPDPDARAAVLAAGQDGLLSTADVDACGLTVDQRKDRLASGRWEHCVRGVYKVAGSPDTWRQRARAAQMAVVHAGGVTSHVTSAALHGLLPPSMLPHVTVPPTASARCPIAKVHRAVIDGVETTTVDGIRTTSVSRMVIDMAGLLDRPSLEVLVDDAICQGRCSPTSILRALDRTPVHRRGRVLLRSVLEVWVEGIEVGSPAEVRLLRRLLEWGLPAPVTQHEVLAQDGTFVARVDAAWPQRMVALEYEGHRYHAARAVGHDEARYARLRALGWRVVATDKHDLLPGSRRLLDLLSPWLLASGAA